MNNTKTQNIGPNSQNQNLGQSQTNKNQNFFAKEKSKNLYDSVIWGITAISDSFIAVSGANNQIKVYRNKNY